MIFNIIFFQNCGKVSIEKLANSEALIEAVSVSEPFIDISDMTLLTPINQEIQISIGNTTKNSTISLGQIDLIMEKNIPNGNVKILIDEKKILFTPTYGFRGETQFTLYTSALNFKKVQNVKVIVQNPTLDFNPALAVRAPECLLCHAKVQGDFVSDFGIKSNKDDKDLLGTNTKGWISAYSFAHSGSNTLIEPETKINGNFYIPDLDLSLLDKNVSRVWFPNSDPITAGIKTLKEYLEKFSNPSSDKVNHPEFRGFVAKKNIYIGSPTSDEIKKSGNLNDSQKINFYKNSPNSLDYSGFVEIKKDNFQYFGNIENQVFKCEGDLLIDGVVFLDHLQVETVAGCRIYATRSVFINGPIKYINPRALTNLQISSANGIYLGMGMCFQNLNPANCADGESSINRRFSSIIDETGALDQLRNTTADEVRKNTLIDFAKISNIKLNDPKDAPAGTVDLKQYYLDYFKNNNVKIFDGESQLFGNLNTGYSRLLLNAPVVMSRYSGNFEGIVIAEFAMWRLGAFQFTFDPVFTGVPLLPFLKLDKIFKVSEDKI